jgi:hypothetical protein
MFLEDVYGISLEHAATPSPSMGGTAGLRRTRLGRMAVSGSNEVPAPQERRAATADGSWMLWTAIGIGGIWVAVVLISLFSPDMVSGSEQEHQKVAAFHNVVLGRGEHARVLVGHGSTAR